MRYRRLILALMAVLGAGLVGLLAAASYVRTSVPDSKRDGVIPGLTAPVEVWRDALGVPHIWAETEADLLRAQGYVHAQDRLWQLELVRRVAEGRLAEVLGEELVETDRFLRTLGHWRAAGLREEALDAETRALLDAYVEGVNAWIRSRRGALPPEFLILRIKPQPWTVRHTLAIETLMAWDLAAYSTARSVAESVARIGEEWEHVLVPEYPEWAPTILREPLTTGGAEVSELSQTEGAPRAASYDGASPDAAAYAGAASAVPYGGHPRASGTRVQTAADRLERAVPPVVPQPAQALLAGISISRGSNSWVIGGQRTRSGKPILANDMHLELRAPSLWYLNALHARRAIGEAAGEPDGLHVAGLSLPGAPLVVAGHNRALAWGYTNAYVQDVDLVRERLDPSDPDRYLTPDGSEPFEVVHERIDVRGRDTVVVAVRWTRNGPVLEDAAAPADEVLVLRWIAHRPSQTMRGLLAMNRATDWPSFLGGVRDFNNPHQNIVYADTAGHIGYVMGGRVPVRGPGRPPSAMPVPGWTGEWDWTGWLDFEDHPRAFDPAAGYIVTANNRQARDATTDLVALWWEPPFRAIRIEEMIRDGGPFDTESVAAMQVDVRDAFAARYRDLAVAAAQRAGLGEAAELLSVWDAEATTDSQAAALFNVWTERTRVAAARSLYGGTGGWFGRNALVVLLERRALPWVEEDAAAAFDSLTAAAMTEAARIADGKTWGELHAVRVAHPLGEVQILDRVLRLSMGPEAQPGSPTTVNVSYYGGSTFPVTSSVGASQRHVVDLADTGAGGAFVVPTGQSGVPFSRHYRDQFELWRGGRLWQVALDRDAAASRTVARMRLDPATDDEG